MAADYCVVMITAPDEAEAARLGRFLVEQELAACVQTMPINSVYRWAGALQADSEVLMLAKTRSALLDELVERLTQEHSYDVPEIITVPIISGAAGYLRWVSEQTTPSS